MRYDKYFYHKNTMGCFNIAVDKLLFFGSDKLRKAIKKAKLVGLQFRNTYGQTHGTIAPYRRMR
jgi:hypothetical protein